METSVRDFIKNEVKKNPNWLDAFGTKEITILARLNSDILEEEVEVIDSQGFKINKRIIPRKYLDKYVLYETLRKNRRVKKNDHGEKMLKLRQERKKTK
jgi:hypothetical protein